jgi:hypothetical protein
MGLFIQDNIANESRAYAELRYSEADFEVAHVREGIGER